MATSSAVANLVLAIHARNYTHAALSGVSRGLATVRTDAVLAGAALATGVGAGTLAALKSASDFQRTMVQTAALTGSTAQQIGASNQQMAQGFVGTSKQVLDAVGQTGRSAQDLGEALYFIASSGFTKAADAEQLMVLSGKDATIGHVQAKVAADALTTSLNAYGAGASQAARYNDILLQGVNLGKAEFGDFARSLGNVLPLAAQAGVRFQDVTAALSTLTLSGLSPRRAAMDLNRLIQSILQPTKGQRQMAIALGIDFSKADLSTPAGLVRFLDLVRSKVDAFPKGEQAAIFKHLFSNQAAILGAQVLTNNIANLQNNVAVMNKTVGNGTVTNRAYAEVSGTLSAQFQKLQAEVGKAAIQIGGQLSPVALRLVQIAGALLPGALRFLTNLIAGLLHPTAAWRTALAFAAGTAHGFASALGGLFSTLGTVAGALGRLLGPLAGSRAGLHGAQQASVGLGTALGLLVPAVLAYIGLARTVSALTLAWTAATKAWTVVTKGATGAQALLNLVMAANPIALIIVAIVALTLAVVYAWNHWRGFHNFLVGAWAFLAGVFGPALRGLAAFLGGAFSAAWSLAQKAASALWHAVRVFWQLIVDNVIPALHAFAQNLGGEVAQAWAETQAKAQLAWDLLKAFWTWLTTVFNLSRIGQAIKDALGGAFDDVKNKIIGFLEIWKGALSALSHVPGMGWIKGALDALKRARAEVDAHDRTARAAARHHAAVVHHAVVHHITHHVAPHVAPHVGPHVTARATTAAATPTATAPALTPAQRSRVEAVLAPTVGPAGRTPAQAAILDFQTAMAYFRASAGLDPADVKRMAADIAALRAADPERAARLQEQLDTALAHRREAIRHQGAVAAHHGEVAAHHTQVLAQRAAHHAAVVRHHNQVAAHQADVRRAGADVATLQRTIHSEIREHRFAQAARDIARYRVLVQQDDKLKGLDPGRAKADADARARTLVDELHRAQTGAVGRVPRGPIAPAPRYGALAGETGYGQTVVSFGGAQVNPLAAMVAALREQISHLRAQLVKDDQVIALLELNNSGQGQQLGVLRSIAGGIARIPVPPGPSGTRSAHSVLKAAGSYAPVTR